MIEKIQRKFTKFLYNKRLISPPGITEFHYHPCLDILNMQSLEIRRVRCDLTMLLRVISREISLPNLNSHIRDLNNHNINIRNQRTLTPVLNSSTSLNRWVKLFLDYRIDYSAISTVPFTTARNTVYSTLPHY